MRHDTAALSGQERFLSCSKKGGNAKINVLVEKHHDTAALSGQERFLSCSKKGGEMQKCKYFPLSYYALARHDFPSELFQ